MQHSRVTIDSTFDNAYHLLRASLSKFGKNPSELNSSELNEVQIQAEQGFELERKIISSSEAQGVVLTKSLVTKMFDDVKKRYTSEDEFIHDLELNNLNEKKLYDALYRELLVETVLDKVASRSPEISKMDIMIYFYLHKEKFTKPETREAYHILITLNDDYEENTREEALSRLSVIRKRLLKKPGRFGEQALKHSECPTALNNGLLGNIPQGELYPELDEVMFSLKEGEISDIIESPTGLHLLHCKSISNAGPVSLKTAEPKIREHLLAKRRRMCQKNWLSELTQGHPNN